MKTLIFLAFFVCLLNALVLNISVVDSDLTPMIGSEIKIYKGEQLIENKTANEFQKYGEKRKALASFSLEPGVYFIKVLRSNYKEHVDLIQLSQDIELQIILLKDSSTYTLYGIIENATNYEGNIIYALDESGKTAFKSKIYPGGYFLVNYLYPNKKYRLALIDIENKKFGPYFSYPEPKSYFVKLDLEQEKNFQTFQIEFFGPQKVEVPSKIELILKEGQNPLANKEVLAILPNGKNLSLITDENGKVGLNAIEQGDYVFKYQNISFITTAYKIFIESPPEKDNQTQQIKENAQQINQDIKQTNQQEQPKTQIKTKPIQTNQESQIIFLISFTALSGILIFFLIYILLTKRK